MDKSDPILPQLPQNVALSEELPPVYSSSALTSSSIPSSTQPTSEGDEELTSTDLSVSSAPASLNALIPLMRRPREDRVLLRDDITTLDYTNPDRFMREALELVNRRAREDIQQRNDFQTGLILAVDELYDRGEEALIPLELPYDHNRRNIANMIKKGIDAVITNANRVQRDSAANMEAGMHALEQMLHDRFNDKSYYLNSALRHSQKRIEEMKMDNARRAKEMDELRIQTYEALENQASAEEAEWASLEQVRHKRELMDEMRKKHAQRERKWRREQHKHQAGQAGQAGQQRDDPSKPLTLLGRRGLLDLPKPGDNGDAESCPGDDAWYRELFVAAQDGESWYHGLSDFGKNYDEATSLYPYKQLPITAQVTKEEVDALKRQIEERDGYIKRIKSQYENLLGSSIPNSGLRQYFMYELCQLCDYIGDIEEMKANLEKDLLKIHCAKVDSEETDDGKADEVKESRLADMLDTAHGENANLRPAIQTLRRRNMELLGLLVQRDEGLEELRESLESMGHQLQEEVNDSLRLEHSHDDEIRYRGEQLSEGLLLQEDLKKQLEEKQKENDSDPRMKELEEKMTHEQLSKCRTRNEELRAKLEDLKARRDRAGVRHEELLSSASRLSDVEELVRRGRTQGLTLDQELQSLTSGTSVLVSLASMSPSQRRSARSTGLARDSPVASARRSTNTATKSNSALRKSQTALQTTLELEAKIEESGETAASNQGQSPFVYPPLKLYELPPDRSYVAAGLRLANYFLHQAEAWHQLIWFCIFLCSEGFQFMACLGTRIFGSGQVVEPRQPRMPPLPTHVIGRVLHHWFLYMTFQVWISSRRQLSIWMAANGRTRRYMIESWYEPPSWMGIPGVDRNLMVGPSDVSDATWFLGELVSQSFDSVNVWFNSAVELLIVWMTS